MNVLALAGDAGGARVLSPVMKRLATQPGVTLQDNEIHIRGGRADDTMFVVDGMSVNDPLAGGGYGYQIDPSIIGGLVVRVGDRLIDGSVRGRLERLRSRLVSGAL